MLRIHFLGAAREVTGSFHLLEIEGTRIALDCGLFQGRRAEAGIKNRSFPIEVKSIDAVVLSHAHIDHSGRLPLLVKSGFEGPIYATPATRDLCAIMLADSAYIQEEDARYLNRKRRPEEEVIEPLYGRADAVQALRQFRAVSHDQEFPITARVRARFFETGHMLGSAGAQLTIPDGQDRPVRLVFSGDLGRFDLPILRDPAPLPECDFLICESTYGNRTSPAPIDLPAQLAEVIDRTFQRGGKVIVPAFSVGRSQTIIYAIRQLIDQGRKIPVFLDSPLAIRATEVFQMHPECYDSEAWDLHNTSGDLLGDAACTYIRSVEESKALNHKRAPCVIISASGMCESGRILHHLKNNIHRAKNTVLIVGFQAAHTLGRRLVEKEKKVRIFRKTYPVKAEVVVLNGFSAHADQHELDRLTRPTARTCREIFLVHGEADQMEAFAGRLRSSGFRRVTMPERGANLPLATSEA